MKFIAKFERYSGWIFYFHMDAMVVCHSLEGFYSIEMAKSTVSSRSILILLFAKIQEYSTNNKELLCVASTQNLHKIHAKNVGFVKFLVLDYYQFPKMTLRCDIVKVRIHSFIQKHLALVKKNPIENTL